MTMLDVKTTTFTFSFDFHLYETTTVRLRLSTSTNPKDETSNLKLSHHSLTPNSLTHPLFSP